MAFFTSGLFNSSHQDIETRILSFEIRDYFSLSQIFERLGQYVIGIFLFAVLILRLLATVYENP